MMKLPSTITDNITELLIKIIEFTQARQKVLAQNINGIDRLGYVPKDLEVDAFSTLLHEAIEEHTRSRRLMLRDTENIKFGSAGCFEVEPIVDGDAKKLLDNSRDEYLLLQIDKLLENSLNQRVAAELLKQKQGMVSVFE